MKNKRAWKCLVTAAVSVLLLFAGTGCTGEKEGKIIGNDKKGIPDKVLYEAVLAFGDANEDGILTIEEAAAMENLAIVEEPEGIAQLKGLEYCTGLKNLYLNGQGITNLSALSELQNLDYLVLHHNKITDISPLAELKNLRVLYLKDNAITDVDKLAEMTGLEVLVLSENKIADAEALGKLTDLKDLYLDKNEITDIRFLAELSGLEELTLNGNKIKDVSALSGLTGLERLSLADNELTKVGALPKLVNLKQLDLSGNQITDLSPLAGLVNVSELNVSSNTIKDISALAGLIKAVEVNASFNQISDVSPLAGMVDLEYLYLNDNQVTDVSPLSGLFALYILDIGNNQIADLSPLYALCMEHYLENLTSLGNPITNTGGIPEYAEYEEEVTLRYLSEKDRASLMEQFELAEYEGKVICRGEFFDGMRKYSPYDIGYGCKYTVSRDEAGELVLEETDHEKVSSMRAFEGWDGKLAVVWESGNCWFIYGGDGTESGLEFTDGGGKTHRVEPFAKTKDAAEQAGKAAKEETAEQTETDAEEELANTTPKDVDYEGIYSDFLLGKRNATDKEGISKTMIPEFEDFETFELYLPGYRITELPEEYFRWDWGERHMDGILTMYHLYNVGTGDTFHAVKE